ncbi:MAG: NTP transferase domain-containing protein, partial [Deltaproteobacteria bacterium]|nr:NTP transferase domain-containing protein [Deltaproteobacteria bacterium]
MTQSSISPKSLRRYAAVILCGGKSSRMGFDKTLLTLRDGRRLLAATAEKLSERFGEVVLAVGSEERLGQFSDFSGYTLVADDHPHSGPAGAVASALSEVAPRAAFVMAGDMVKVDFGLIERLADLIEAGAEAAVPVHGGRKEPLYAFYASSAGPFLAEAAREGRGTLREAFPKLRTLFLELFDSELAPGLFENINTPEEAMAASLNPPANLSPKAEEASPLFGLDAQALQTTKKEGVEDQASKQKGPAFQVSQASRMRDPASPVLEQDSQAPPALELERPDALGLELDFKGSEGTRSLSAAFRSIPKVDKVLALARQSGGPLSGLSPEALVLAVREALARRREAIAQGRESEPWEPLAAVAQEAEKQAKPGLSPVINATGVVLHTNLGRAPLSKEAAQSVAKIASGYSSLEYDPHLGRRASRQRHVEKLLLEIFGGEAALAVNNNAAALLLVAAALAPGREVIISRGELVEIGASFRLGDILEAGGAILREVGSTNRTAAADYERAAQSGSPALIMSVHAGNFRLVGYGGRPEMKEL